MLLNPRTVIAPLHRVGPQLLVIDVPQGGLEGEDDVLVGGDLAAGLTAFVDTGALHEAVPADVVRRVVLAGQHRAFPPPGRGLDGLGAQNRVEGEAVAAVGLAEDTETP